MQLTRRELLAGIGLGTLGVGGLTFGSGRPRYTHYTYASDGDLDDRRVRVAWYERYNGVFQESQNGTTDAGIDQTLDPDSAPDYVTEATFVTDATGPVLSVGGVMPGDEGTLVVGLEVVDDGDFIAEPLDIWLRATLVDDAESGVNGPERAAGDSSPSDGELDDEVLVELWRDGSPLGTCNGRRDIDEQLNGPVVNKQPLSAAFAPGSPVGDADGERVLRSVSPGSARCLALAWSFPAATASNRSQGDSVAFDLRFGGVPVGAASPFSTGGQQ